MGWLAVWVGAKRATGGHRARGRYYRTNHTGRPEVPQAALITARPARLLAFTDRGLEHRVEGRENTIARKASSWHSKITEFRNGEKLVG